jgi:FlaA1/EpsC-like NDP-sugar epimerase
MKSYQSRRKFLTTAVSGIAASLVAPTAFAGEFVEQGVMTPTIVSNEVSGAANRFRVAILGVNSRGKELIETVMKQPDIELVSLCDPDPDVLKVSAKWFEDIFQQKVAVEQDYRKINADKNIDAVIIATPDHWHSLHAIYAYQADKDVFIEKPAIKQLRNELTGRAGAFQIAPLPLSPHLLRVFCQTCGF